MAHQLNSRGRDMTINPATYGALPATGYIRQSQLIPAIFPFSSATLWRMVKAGTFPKPVKLGPRITAWRVEDIQEPTSVGNTHRFWIHMAFADRFRSNLTR
jgi:predicted DNA-binding transcriptional regulator AlpA